MPRTVSRRRLLATGLALAAAGPAPAAEAVPEDGRYARFLARGPFADPARFPVGVWLQSPANARAWAGIGINLYVNLWKGPTAAQLDALAAAGMPVIAAQNEIALSPRYRDTVIGWMAHPDEPDNAQPLPGGGYGAPVPPEEMQARYAAMRARDPSRPVLLNLGQGVTWDGWFGRGARTDHPEDYPRYIEGADIVSFDVYPVTSRHAPVAGRIELIGRGVQRLRGWARAGQGVWAVIGASRIGNATRRPNPAELRAQAFMAIAHGAQGIVWFAHQFAPRFVEAAPLREPDTRAALAAVNAEIAGLAPVLGRGRPEPGLRPQAGAGVTVRALAHDGALWLICINDRPAPTRLRLRLPGAMRGVEPATGVRVASDAAGRITLGFAGYQPRILRLG